MKTKIFERQRKKELLELTVRQLIKGPAKALNISGRWDMKKDELIEAILRAELSGQEPVADCAESAKDEFKNDGHFEDVVEKCENETAVENIDMSQKMRYVETVEAGALVAFRLSNGKVKSAKVMKRSSKNRKLKVETEYGASYIVSYEDVLWVRTGKRWPRGVYNLLKGIEEDEKSAS